MPLNSLLTTPDILPPLAISMGCPVGIGPEIILKLFAGLSFDQRRRLVVVGDRSVLERVAGELGYQLPMADWRPGGVCVDGVVQVLSLSSLAADVSWGNPTVATGQAMIRYIEEAVRLIQHGVLSGLVTCPITKTALRQAGSPFPGHTEMLAALCVSDRYAMMMAGDRLRVVLATIHQPLAAVPALLNEDSLVELIALTSRCLIDDFGLAKPRIAVAGLNPHAGEAGMFGREEEAVILPTVLRARAMGLPVAGPLPPDTVFFAAARGDYDAVVCMYHDQGLIPFKLLHFHDGVNVTIGLPIVRTSVDHGTAYDIAGKGIADCGSLAAACRLAWHIVTNRQQNSSLQER